MAGARAAGGATILFVAPRFHTNLYYATRALREAGHRVEVLAASSAPTEDHGHVVPRVLGAAPGRARVRAALREIAPDLVLLRNSGALSRHVAALTRGGAARVLAYDLRPLTQRRGWRKRLGLRLRGMPAGRVTPVRGLDRAAPTDPLAHYLPWPVARGDGADAPRRGARARVTVLCVGKLAQPRKNQHLLIDALREAGPAGRVRLVLAGSTMRGITGADEAHFAALCDAARREDWIEMRADLDFSDMAGLYRDADICVMPSVGEPLGHAPTEGMAYGCVPVVSVQSGSAGYIEHGQNGLRVDMDRPETLAAALRDLLADADLRARLSAGALHTAETELSPARFVQRIEDLLPRRVR